MNASYIVDEPGLLALAARMSAAWVQHQGGSLCVLLHGDLGAGKTTFTRGFLNGCGYDGVVKSPTYTLVEPYSISDKRLYHFDLYRIADPEELEFTGARDYFDDEAACFVEWPEKAASMLPEADLDIELSVEGDARRIELKGLSPLAQQLMLASQAD